MMHSTQRGLVETLLNTLEAERYVRGPLLATIADELGACIGLDVAADEARAILERLESGELGEAEFVARVTELRHLVHTLAAPPASGEVSIGETLSRALPRYSLAGGSVSAA